MKAVHPDEDATLGHVAEEERERGPDIELGIAHPIIPLLVGDYARWLRCPSQNDPVESEVCLGDRPRCVDHGIGAVGNQNVLGRRGPAQVNDLFAIVLGHVQAVFTTRFDILESSDAVQIPTPDDTQHDRGTDMHVAHALAGTVYFIECPTR